MATSINSYSVSLSLNARDYIQNSALSRTETNALARQINQARTPTENYERSIRLLDRALKSGTIELRTYNRLVAEAKLKTAGAAKETENLTSKITKYISAYILLSKARQGVTWATRLSMDAEDASVAFEVLTGDVNRAATMVQDLRDLAARSPITLSGAQSSARTMMMFGVAVDDVIPALQAMGNIVGGDTERLRSMSLAFAQMTAAGKLQGQDLLQMVNAGFNPLQEIARQLGEKDIVRLRKEMEAGRISAQMVASAFRTAAEEGGAVHGMSDRLAENLSGKLNIALSETENLGRTLGETFIPLEKVFADTAGSLAKLVAQGVELSKSGLFDIFTGEPFKHGERAGMPAAFRKMLDQQGVSGFMRKPVTDIFSKIMKGPENVRGTSGDMLGLGDALTSGLDSLKTGAGGLMDGWATFQSAAAGIAMSGMADTKEIISAVTEDPAIASLEAGTQEAYAFLTQGMKEAEAASRLNDDKQKQLAENAKAQRDKMTEWLSRISLAVENNGFAKARN